MLTPTEAQRIIADAMPSFEAEAVDARRSRGRVLRETVRAERDQPPFDRVTMDGIAFRYAEFEAGCRRFRIAFTQHAGDAVRGLTESGTCAEVMTGSVLPPGADTVVPVERIATDGGSAEIAADYRPTSGQFVHRRASDHAAGAALLPPGSVVTPADIAVIASAGRTSVDVARAPTVRIVSTGNELVPAGDPIADHQVRLSNGPALVAMLADHRFDDARSDHLPDEPETLEARLAEHLQQADVLILSGGVSMGKADFVPGVLENLRVEKLFQRISQRPGKPLWFGRGADGQAVFALPGNPVSATVCCRHYVLPALYAASGRRQPPPRHAVLARDVTFTPALTCFMPVKLGADTEGRRLADPVATNTSGDFTALSGTDGYVELAAETSEFAAQLAVPFHPWRIG